MGNSMLGRYGDLHPGERLISPDGRTVFTLQDDGNLVLLVDGRYIWGTQTNDPYFGQLHWGPETDARSPGKLHLADDGNLVLLNKSNAPIWTTKTNTDPPHRDVHLVVQNDNNVVLYFQNDNGDFSDAKWSTKTQNVLPFRRISVENKGSAVSPRVRDCRDASLAWDPGYWGDFYWSIGDQDDDDPVPKIIDFGTNLGPDGRYLKDIVGYRGVHFGIHCEKAKPMSLPDQNDVWDTDHTLIYDDAAYGNLEYVVDDKFRLTLKA